MEPPASSRPPGRRCERCARLWVMLGLVPGVETCLVCGGALVDDGPGFTRADVVRAAVVAFSEPDPVRLLDSFSDDIEWRPTSILLGESARPYSGRDDMQAWLEDIGALWADVRLIERELHLAAGDRVLVLGALTATSRETGTALAEPIAILCQVEGGRIRQMDEFLDWSEARRVAGLPAD